MFDGDACKLPHYSHTCGSGRCTITLSATMTEDGIAAFISGGSMSHIGAVVVYFPSEDEADDASGGDGTQSIVRRGHRDQVIAQIVAEGLGATTESAVFVLSGFHVDDISQNEIATVIENTKCVTREFIASLERAKRVSCEWEEELS